MSIQENPDEPRSLMVATPEQYAAAALSKCTSGVHHGYTPHEIVGLIIENLKDIVPIELPMKFFANRSKQKALDTKKG